MTILKVTNLETLNIKKTGMRPIDGHKLATALVWNYGQDRRFLVSCQ